MNIPSSSLQIGDGNLYDFFSGFEQLNQEEQNTLLSSSDNREKIKSKLIGMNFGRSIDELFEALQSTLFIVGKLNGVQILSEDELARLKSMDILGRMVLIPYYLEYYTNATYLEVIQGLNLSMPPSKENTNQGGDDILIYIKNRALLRAIGAFESGYKLSIDTIINDPTLRLYFQKNRDCQLAIIELINERKSISLLLEFLSSGLLDESTKETLDLVKEMFPSWQVHPNGIEMLARILRKIPIDISKTIDK